MDHKVQRLASKMLKVWLGRMAADALASSAGSTLPSRLSGPGHQSVPVRSFPHSHAGHLKVQKTGIEGLHYCFVQTKLPPNKASGKSDFPDYRFHLPCGTEICSHQEICRWQSLDNPPTPVLLHFQFYWQDPPAIPRSPEIHLESSQVSLFHKLLNMRGRSARTCFSHLRQAGDNRKHLGTGTQFKNGNRSVR